MSKTAANQAAKPRKVIRRPTEELKERLHQTLARQIGIEIVTGVYQPGQSLPGEIAASGGHGVSRNAYREAVKILAAKGLVESRQKAGTLVLGRDRWNLLDPDVLSWILSNNPDADFRDGLFELRKVIEPAAAGFAAERRSERDVQRLKEALTQMRRCAVDSPEGQSADQAFHSAVFNAGGNEVLSRLASIISASVEYVAEFKRSKSVDRDPIPDHEVLYEAIVSQDPKSAREAMVNLIVHAREDTL